MSGIWFGGVKAEVEGGVVFSGDPKSLIDGITLTDSSIAMTKSSSSEGGYRDFRPAEKATEEDFDIPIFYVEYANHVSINNTKVRTHTLYHVSRKLRIWKWSIIIKRQLL